MLQMAKQTSPRSVEEIKQEVLKELERRKSRLKVSFNEEELYEGLEDTLIG